MISFGGGGTKEIADRPRGRKATYVQRGRSAEAIQTLSKSVATQRIYYAFQHRQWVLTYIYSTQITIDYG